MFVTWLAIASCLREAVEGDDADGTGMSGRWRHKAEHSVDEAPIAVEKGSASIDEMLQHGPNVRESSGITFEWRQCFGSTVLQLQPTVSSDVNEQAGKGLNSLTRVSDSDLGEAIACITTDCYEGRLHTGQTRKQAG